jgi:hypothetical protein
MLPHERSLVERMKDAPFALIGVNSDKNFEEAKKQFADAGPAPWRHFADGSTSGPIATRWNIHGWPTLFVLDAEGKIRQKYVGGPEEATLDQQIDGLVSEAKAAKPADAKSAKDPKKADPAKKSGDPAKKPGDPKKKGGS